jgi:hypothetical protein
MSVLVHKYRYPSLQLASNHAYLSASPAKVSATI